jgi:RNA recognition motif-containing protein
MENRIYVGNLPWSVDLAKLKELFSSYGEIEDAIVMANKYTGRSRGFGFVTFKEESSAQKAVAEMNKKDVEGRELNVTIARPLEKKE